MLNLIPQFMNKSLLFYLFTYFVMLLVIFILPYFSSESYSIFKHTTSQLGGQNMPNAWILNVIFVFLGLSSVIASWRYLSSFWLQKILILVFGVALIGTAIYSHSPIEQHLPANDFENYMHSIFAKITGYSFTSFAVAMAFIFKERTQILIALVVAILDTILSATMFQLPAVTGILQRAIFITSFGWLGYIVFRQKDLK